MSYGVYPVRGYLSHLHRSNGSTPLPGMGELLITSCSDEMWLRMVGLWLIGTSPMGPICHHERAAGDTRRHSTRPAARIAWPSSAVVQAKGSSHADRLRAHLRVVLEGSQPGGSREGTVRTCRICRRKLPGVQHFRPNDLSLEAIARSVRSARRFQDLITY